MRDIQHVSVHTEKILKYSYKEMSFNAVIVINSERDVQISLPPDMVDLY